MKYTRKCKECGEEFIATRKDKKYCSSECRDKFNHKKEDYKIKARDRSNKWYKENKKYANIQSSLYNAQHKEQHRECCLKYYYNNKDKCNERNRLYCEDKTSYETIGNITICHFGNIECLIDTEDLERVQSTEWLVYGGYIRSYDFKYRLHRFIMNCDDENLVVHHINENPLDNTKENLIVLTISQHSSLHNNYIRKIGRALTREEIQNVLLLG